MADRSVILQIGSSACPAVCGVAALFGMMSQFISPGWHTLAWISGGAFSLGVVGMVVLSCLADQLPAPLPSRQIEHKDDPAPSAGPRFVEVSPRASTQAELKPTTRRTASGAPE